MNCNAKYLVIILAGCQFTILAMYRNVYSLGQKQSYMIPIWNAVDERETCTTGGSLLGVPVVGTYGENYVMRDLCVLLKEPDLVRYASQQVQKAVAGRDVDGYIMILGKKQDSEDFRSKTNNIVLHPVVRKWIADSPDFVYSRPDERFKDRTPFLPDYDQERGLYNFSVLVRAGVFDADNVISPEAPRVSGSAGKKKQAAAKKKLAAASPDSMPLDRLGDVNVIFHGDCQFSPDNARIYYGTGPVATFWLVALSPFSNHALVAFITVILDEKLGKVYNDNFWRPLSGARDVASYERAVCGFVSDRLLERVNKLISEITGRPEPVRRPVPELPVVEAVAPVPDISPARVERVVPESPVVGQLVDREPVAVPAAADQAVIEKQMVETVKMLRVLRHALKVETDQTEKAKFEREIRVLEKEIQELKALRR